MIDNDKFIKFWEPNSQKGKHVYALTGAIIFSVLFSIFKEIFYWLIFERDQYTFRPGAVVINLITIFTIMYFYKRWEWNKNEKRYQELKQKE